MSQRVVAQASGRDFGSAKGAIPMDRSSSVNHLSTNRDELNQAFIDTKPSERSRSHNLGDSNRKQSDRKLGENNSLKALMDQKLALNDTILRKTLVSQAHHQ